MAKEWKKTYGIIKSGDQYIAVDAGASKAATEDELRSLGISSDDVCRRTPYTHSQRPYRCVGPIQQRGCLYWGKRGFGAGLRTMKYCRMAVHVLHGCSG